MKPVPNDTYAIFLPAKNIPVGLYVLFIGRFLSLAPLRIQHTMGLLLVKLTDRIIVPRLIWLWHHGAGRPNLQLSQVQFPAIHKVCHVTQLWWVCSPTWWWWRSCCSGPRSCAPPTSSSWPSPPPTSCFPWWSVSSANSLSFLFLEILMRVIAGSPPNANSDKPWIRCSDTLHQVRWPV